ncbi:phosphonates transport ATP-binding protein PhnL [Escherichia coli]|nr:phosphonates transport ATP-binding protein PhnL [Escherichia coli]
MNKPLLSVNNLTHLYAPGKGFSDVSFDLWPGEVLGIVGESGSGKTTLLKSISARLTPQQGEIHYENRSLYAMSEADRRRLLRTEWGVVHQHPLDGLRRQVSAGGNIGERLMATGARHYGDIRATAQKWLEEVEIPANRIDDLPTTFSGGMQQRLQIARNLVTHPKLVFMDEPTGGLDVSVQARLLDLLRGLVVELNLAVVIVTHDLGVARLLADRLLVMKQGQVVESGLTDRVLDDPHHPYTQLLVSSVFAELSRCRMRRKRLIRPTNALPVGRIRRVSVASDTRTTRRKMINVQNVSKTFILHQQNGVRLPVLNRASLTVNAGECVVLHGHSGSGKSTLLRSLYANYLPDEGQIQIKHGDEWVDLVTAPARKVVEIRKTTVGWVSQFLRVIPRISALEVVMQPLLDTGVPREACAAKAARLLTRLNVPERLWHLAPSTFSGGEQQRVNIARGFIVDYPILLLDEPTASLDAKNSAAVVELIREAKTRGAAIVGIFHDEAVRNDVADRLHPMGASS